MSYCESLMMKCLMNEISEKEKNLENIKAIFIKKLNK